MREIIGWLTPEVGAAMRNLIWKSKPDVCVEIGVFAGKSLINTALALKENGKGVVYGIDPWRKEVAIANTELTKEDPNYWASIDLDAVHYDCMRAIWQHELEQYAVIIRARSQDARFLIGKQEIDILYIDGGHSEKQSTYDALTYGGMVRPRGFIWMDDTNYDSVKNATLAVEQSHNCRLVRDFGHSRLYQKL